MPVKKALSHAATDAGHKPAVGSFWLFLLFFYPAVGYTSYKALDRLLMEEESSVARVKFITKIYLAALFFTGYFLIHLFSLDHIGTSTLQDPTPYLALGCWTWFFYLTRHIHLLKKLKSSLTRPSFWIFSIFTYGLYIPYLFSKAATKGGLSEKTMKGNSAIRGSKEALSSLSILSRKEAGGSFKLHPSLFYPKSYENKHILLVGTVGSGKTQALFPMVDSIRAQRDRMIIYDRKGDFTEAFGEDEGVVILSPFDKRSVGWDIAKDIRSEILAEELAASLIPISHEGHDQVWIEAARDIFAGVVLRVIAERGNDWQFKDLMTILESREEVISSCKNHRPGALMNLGSSDGDDRQSAGIFMCLRSSGSKKMRYLSSSWDEKGRKLSIKDWVNDENSPIRTIIIRGNPRYKELDEFVAVQIYGQFFAELSALSDSSTRRIWAVIDELGNLPKISRLTQALTEYRSKGLAIIGAIQDIGQIRARYGREEAQAWFTSFAALLAGRVGDPETAGFLSKAFGQVQIERSKSSFTKDSSDFFTKIRKGGSSDSMSYSKDIVTEQLLLDAEFLNLPHASLKDGAFFWLRVGGWPAAKLNYPVTPTPKRYLAASDESWL